MSGVPVLPQYLTEWTAIVLTRHTYLTFLFSVHFCMLAQPLLHDSPPFYCTYCMWLISYPFDSIFFAVATCIADVALCRFLQYLHISISFHDSILVYLYKYCTSKANVASDLVFCANAPYSVLKLLTDYYTIAPSHCLSYPQLGGLMPRE